MSNHAGRPGATRATELPVNSTSLYRGELMHHLHHHPIRSSLLAGTMVMAIGLLGGTAAAQASPCVIGPGVTQTDTVVTGSPGNDTIDCGGTNPGKTINGNGGND